ncbi:hypothetical protein [Hydrogenophaga sp. 2FB]|uniref:hypothetical protein n=1 Tax=Hydrogenophaga sp. 2FB TaxID=2502187 RepID=UPI0010FA4069|nr:hypothetical protein [Hydrogenophaga sp. 2FB]
MTANAANHVHGPKVGSTWAVIFVGSALIAVRQPSGCIPFEADDLLQIVTPVAGTFVALVLAATQLAASSLQEILKEAQSLIRTDESSKDVASYAKKRINETRLTLETMKCIITFSIAALVFGLVGLMGLRQRIVIDKFSLVPQDLFAALSFLSLLASVFWVIKLVKIGFDYTQVESVIAYLDGEPPKETNPIEVSPEKPADGVGQGVSQAAEQAHEAELKKTV